LPCRDRGEPATSGVSGGIPGGIRVLVSTPCTHYDQLPTARRADGLAELGALRGFDLDAPGWGVGRLLNLAMDGFLQDRFFR
jgi:hypothetical protein